MMRIIAIACFILALAGCSASETNSTTAAVYPDQTSKGFQQFSKQCSSCHRPPMPNQHTAQEWEGVVAVMQTHKAQAGMEIMNPQETTQVLSYLQQHSRTNQP